MCIALMLLTNLCIHYRKYSTGVSSGSIIVMGSFIKIDQLVHISMKVVFHYKEGMVLTFITQEFLYKLLYTV